MTINVFFGPPPNNFIIITDTLNFDGLSFPLEIEPDHQHH